MLQSKIQCALINMLYKYSVITLVLFLLTISRNEGRLSAFHQLFLWPNTNLRSGRQLELCPEGQEPIADPALVTEDEFGGSRCRCKPHFLLWPPDGRCYREYRQGPCPHGHRFVRDAVTGEPVCSCPFFTARFISDNKCYKEYTQGPCPRGTLVVRGNDGNATCDCNETMTMYYERESGQCYELYTQGPCNLGQVLMFDYATFRPQCRCRDSYHQHSIDTNCYELNTHGPCVQELGDDCQGTPCFMRSLDQTEVGCRCLPKNAITKDGHCYQPFTRANCHYGKWIVFGEDGEARCERKKYCKRFDNWHWWPPHQRCYRLLSQGPCKRGELFHLDPEKGEAGCGCSSSWRAHYWHESQQCFEHESPGPCSSGQYFNFNNSLGITECKCFDNFVLDVQTGDCVELFSHGNCESGFIVVDDGSGNAKCDCGTHLAKHLWPIDNKCYPHFDQGPCRKNEQFRPHPTKDKPVCVNWPEAIPLG